MSRLTDFFRRIGRGSRRSGTPGPDDGSDDSPGPGTWLSIGGVSIGFGGGERDRDHDGIPDRDDHDSDGADDGDSGDSDGGDSGGDD
jgi:hypothetical protein